MHPSFALTPALAVAALLTLVVGHTTRWFRGPVPSGGDSMALLNPALSWAGSWLLTFCAAWACATRGRAAWLSTNPLVAGLLVTLVVIGLAAMALRCFMLWTRESSALPPAVLVFGAVVVPLTFQTFLLTLAWWNSDTLGGASWPRAAGAVYATAASPGAWMVGDFVARRAGRRLFAKATVREKLVGPTGLPKR